MTKNDYYGIAVYFITAILLGLSTSVLILFIKENSDRCHYYNGSWNKADIIRGIIAIAIGFIARCLIFKYLI